VQNHVHPFRAVMIGCGGYLPDNVVTNHDLSKYVDTNHEWIVERTGIHQRHFALDHQMTSDLAVEAAKQALEMAGLTAQDIDLIVVGTTTPDMAFPSTATIVQHKLGNRKGLAFDVAAVCSGYLLALNIADLYLKTGQAKHALVIGAETLSRLLDMKDRRSCILFGDGAGAVVLKAEPAEQTDQGILGVHLKSDGAYKDILYADRHPLHPEGRPTIHLAGQEVFKHAVTKLAEAVEDILGRYQMPADQLDWMIPHQANIRIIERMAKKLHMPMDKVITTVQKHGNTSAASIPLALNDAIRSGKVKPGQYILHEAIGGGLVWGAALLKY
jgi:3-oxoacyl-[acyl-carrier-protein] synthase-3